MDQSNLILAYPENGESIRTLYIDGEVLFCLQDVVELLAAQNTELSKEGEKSGLHGLTKGIIQSLEDDERYFEKEGGSSVGVQYVTQPGLFRIILADKSPACKKFQRWVLHEVLPSIQKYGTYPPPVQKGEATELKRAVEFLLVEIDERERLERETKARFALNEERLEELNDRIAEVGKPSMPDGYLSVSEFCESISPPEKNEFQRQKIFGWCTKICVEEFYQVYKTGSESRYPKEVLLRAHNAAQGVF